MAEGFEPRFGLIGIDYETKQRQVRESAKMYGKIAKENRISDELMKEFGIENPSKNNINK